MNATSMSKLKKAADNAVKICLGAVPGDVAIIIIDSTTRQIGEALEKSCMEIDVKTTTFNIDDFGKRPIKKIPAEIIQALGRADISALAISTPPGELSMRRAIIESVEKYELRHAHMPTIEVESFIDGLAMDYSKVKENIDKLTGILTETKTLKMVSPGGTDIEFVFNPPITCDANTGIINKGRWENLPSGQIILKATSDINGIYCADRSVGGFSERYDLNKEPVLMTFEDAKIVDFQCENKRLSRDFSLLLRSSENSGRISEVDVGANTFLENKHFNSLYQGYIPGASIGIGSSLALKCKPAWISPTFTPLIAQNISLFADGKTIISSGTFEKNILN